MLTLLPKKGGARMHDVSTYHVLCTDPNKHLTPRKTLKPGNELGSSPDAFVHVLLAKTRDKQEVVVKVHEAGTLFIAKELSLMQRLAECKYAVRYICDFKCVDDKKRWMEELRGGQNLCKPDGPHNLHFIVMEYVRNGDLREFLETNTNADALRSLCLQTALALLEMGTVYKVSHGDINSGNILVYKTTKALMTFRVFDKVYKVQSCGFYPVFIDFGRGGLYEATSKNLRYIVDEVLIALSMYNSWIKNNEVKMRLQDIILTINNHTKRNKMECVEDLLRLLKRL